MDGIRRIFYDIVSGEVIQEIGRIGSIILPTIEQDVQTYKDLSDRNRTTFDVIELPFDQYAQDFAECNRYRVNPETKELEFSYPDPNEPTAPPVYRQPLSEEIEGLKQENILNMLAMTDMFEENLRLKEDNTNTMMALTEMYEMMSGGNM
ncbi:hypothetical protein [Exiguobacterium profundum]|uniref:hypothetical protein n=1 Tax=Exiguobacterium profundum TaxID=307643 RepID=UPI003511A045